MDWDLSHVDHLFHSSSNGKSNNAPSQTYAASHDTSAIYSVFNIH